MKRLAVLFVAVCMCLLSGCSHQDFVDEGLSLRDKILLAEGCRFRSVITADYTDRLYTFEMLCEFDKSGNMHFTVTQPELISGIAGKVDAIGGKLTFDDQILAFELLADGQLTPVSAPWIFMKSLRGGYIHSAAQNDGALQLCINDSYETDALEVDVRLNSEGQPVYAEILWKNRRILSLSISEFCIL